MLFVVSRTAGYDFWYGIGLWWFDSQCYTMLSLKLNTIHLWSHRQKLPEWVLEDRGFVEWNFVIERLNIVSKNSRQTFKNIYKSCCLGESSIQDVDEFLWTHIEERAAYKSSKIPCAKESWNCQCVYAERPNLNLKENHQVLRVGIVMSQLVRKVSDMDGKVHTVERGMACYVCEGWCF